MATKPLCHPEVIKQGTNTILGSCDAMQYRGTLKVRTMSRGKDRVVVTISDSGPGMPVRLLRSYSNPT